jgi:hypothetical protein
VNHRVKKYDILFLLKGLYVGCELTNVVATSCCTVTTYLAELTNVVATSCCNVTTYLAELTNVVDRARTRGFQLCHKRVSS